MVKAEIRIIDPYRPELNKTYICYPTETHILNDGRTTYEFHFGYHVFDDSKEVKEDD